MRTFIAILGFVGLFFLALTPAHLARAADIEAGTDPRWLKMNLYKFEDGRYLSEIVNTEFFVARNGRESPQDEFDAFKAVFLAYQKTGEESDILCRFPARYSYLSSIGVQKHAARARPECLQFEKVFRPREIKSLSLVFATGFFGNPSSYYGHVLLKANYDSDSSKTGFLDTSVNYGADITDSTSSIFYIINGLTGGYTAAYKPNNYFLHSHNYVNSELRDLWSYELNLDDTQITNLIEHSWELMHARFAYYFLNDNCANRIARLVEYATGKNIAGVHGYWLMPFQIIRNAEAQGLLRRETYTPSLRTNFEKRFTAAPPAVRQAVLDRLRLERQSREAVAQTGREEVTLALDYYDVEIATQSAKDPGSPELREMQAQRQRALRELAKSKGGSGSRSDLPDKPRSPLLDLSPSMIGIAGQYADEATGTLFSYRGAHNDVLNIGSGVQEVSQFVMGSLEIEARRSQLSIPSLVLIDIGNFASSPLPLDIDTATSWSISVGYDRFTSACTSCSVPVAEAKAGFSRKVGNATLFGMAGARAQGDYQGSGLFAGVGEAGIVQQYDNNVRWQARARYMAHPESGRDDLLLTLELGWRFGKQQDMRIGVYTEGDSDRVVASVRYYFD